MAREQMARERRVLQPWTCASSPSTCLCSTRSATGPRSAPRRRTPLPPRGSSHPAGSQQAPGPPPCAPETGRRARARGLGPRHGRRGANGTVPPGKQPSACPSSGQLGSEVRAAAPPCADQLGVKGSRPLVSEERRTAAACVSGLHRQGWQPRPPCQRRHRLLGEKRVSGGCGSARRGAQLCLRSRAARHPWSGGRLTGCM